MTTEWQPWAPTNVIETEASRKARFKKIREARERRREEERQLQTEKERREIIVLLRGVTGQLDRVATAIEKLATDRSEKAKETS